MLPLSKDAKAYGLAKETESVTVTHFTVELAEHLRHIQVLSFWKQLYCLHPVGKQPGAADTCHCVSCTHTAHHTHWHSLLRDQREWDSSCSIYLSEHLLFSADSCLTADFQQLNLDNRTDFFFLFSKTECIHLEMTDEVNQLKREKRNIREWGREYLHTMWVVVLIASLVWSFPRQWAGRTQEAGARDKSNGSTPEVFLEEDLVQGSDGKVAKGRVYS